MAVVGVFQPFNSRSEYSQHSAFFNYTHDLILTDWGALLQVAEVSREAVHLLAVGSLVTSADLEGLKGVEDIQLGQVEDGVVVD